MYDFLARKLIKISFYPSFQFYFLYIFLVGGNLVFKYEQLFILTDTNTSTLKPHDIDKGSFPKTVTLWDS
jgi:hypothetical protein